MAAREPWPWRTAYNDVSTRHTAWCGLAQLFCDVCNERQRQQCFVRRAAFSPNSGEPGVTDVCEACMARDPTLDRDAFWLLGADDMLMTNDDGEEPRRAWHPRWNAEDDVVRAPIDAPQPTRDRVREWTHGPGRPGSFDDGSLAFARLRPNAWAWMGIDALVVETAEPTPETTAETTFFFTQCDSESPAFGCVVAVRAGVPVDAYPSCPALKEARARWTQDRPGCAAFAFEDAWWPGMASFPVPADASARGWAEFDDAGNLTETAAERD